MSLLIQLRSILYFFLMGVGYSFVLAYLLGVIQCIKYAWIKNMIELNAHILFTVVLYLGLIHVNQGIIHIYFIVSLVIGFFFGYIVYQPFILPLAMRMKHRIEKCIAKFKQYLKKRKAKKQQKRQAKQDASESVK